MEEIVQVIEDHKGFIQFEDIDGTTHVRVAVNGIFLDTDEGTALMDDLTERNVKSNAIHMLMQIVRDLASKANATKMEGAYESTVH